MDGVTAYGGTKPPDSEGSYEVAAERSDKNCIFYCIVSAKAIIIVSEWDVWSEKIARDWLETSVDTNTDYTGNEASI